MAMVLVWLAVIAACSLVLLAIPFVAARRRPVCARCQHNAFVRRARRNQEPEWICANHGVIAAAAATR